MSVRPLLHRPTSEPELLAVLAEHGESAKVVAGGTAFMILWKAGLLRPDHLVGTSAVTGMSSVESSDGVTHIGALARLRDVERSAAVTRSQPVLAAALRLVANVRVRNAATLGGNVAEADPTSDPPAVLSALDAAVELASNDGVRLVPFGDFVVDYFETTIRPDEAVRKVAVPVLGADWGGTYVKFLSRSGEDRTCLGVAAFVRTDVDGTCTGLRLAVVGAAATPLRLPAVEEQVVGQRLTPETVRDVAAQYAAAADPVSDVRGSADYRRAVLPALVLQAVDRAGSSADDAVLA